MGPLFSLGILAFFLSVLLAIAFVVSRAFGQTLRASMISAVAFVTGAIIGAGGIAFVLGLLIGFGKEFESSFAVATYLGVVGVGSLLMGLLASRVARRVVLQNDVPGA